MKSVTYQDVDDFLERLIMAVREKENRPERQELETLIRDGGGLLIGAKALAHYLKPRFTEDTDYLVNGVTFERVRRWFQTHRGTVAYADEDEAIRCETLGIDVIDARNRPCSSRSLAWSPSCPRWKRSRQ